MRPVALLLVLAGLALLPSGASGARPYDGVWSLTINGAITDTAQGTRQQYAQIGILYIVKGVAITSETGLLAGRIDIATGRAAFRYQYFPGQARCPITVQLTRHGTGSGVAHCTLHLPQKGSGTWALAARVTVQLEMRTS